MTVFSLHCKLKQAIGTLEVPQCPIGLRLYCSIRTAANYIAVTPVSLFQLTRPLYLVTREEFLIG